MIIGVFALKLDSMIFLTKLEELVTFDVCLVIFSLIMMSIPVMRLTVGTILNMDDVFVDYRLCSSNSVFHI
jgi:hypothetical protein